MKKETWRWIRGKLFGVWFCVIAILAFPAVVMMVLGSFWLILGIVCTFIPAFWIQRIEQKAGWVDDYGRWKD